MSSHNDQAIINQLRAMANQTNVEGMARFGIRPKTEILGISVSDLRKLAKTIGKRQHELAQQLWASGIHEARILASIIDDPQQVTEAQMERWAADFDTWDICDQCCGNLFDKTPFAVHKAIEWSKRDEEFVKRAAFVLMAYLAVHDKRCGNAPFLRFLLIIDRTATDERQFVKKAVSWALRQIGKRNRALNQSAIIVAERLRERGSKAERWIASDALRELTSEKVQSRW